MTLRPEEPTEQGQCKGAWGLGSGERKADRAQEDNTDAMPKRGRRPRLRSGAGLQLHNRATYERGPKPPTVGQEPHDDRSEHKAERRGKAVKPSGRASGTGRPSRGAGGSGGPGRRATGRTNRKPGKCYRLRVHLARRITDNHRSDGGDRIPGASPERSGKKQTI